ncbi:hypothetical protein ACFFN5_25815, partial [Streptomonospora salina]
MAIQGALPVEFGTVFPHGAYALGVEQITDFETKRPVVETPGIFTGWLWRFLRALVLLPLQFPVSVAVVACSVAAYVLIGWVGVAVLWTVADLGLLAWWRRRPG